MQETATLLEYSLTAVTEGIDAIATTRVVIRGKAGHPSTHAFTGETVYRTFRYVEFIVSLRCTLFFPKIADAYSTFWSVGRGLAWMLLFQVSRLMFLR